MKFPDGEIIAAISTAEKKSLLYIIPDSKVASMGRILGNRSVLYKYLNPNIIAVLTKTTSSIQVYLIDSVSGSIRYKASHPNFVSESDAPATITQYENVIVYCFWKNTVSMSTSTQFTAKQYEIVVLEMFEGDRPDFRIERFVNLLINLCRTNISSFNDDKISVIGNSYGFSRRINTLSVSNTLSGITTKQLLGKCFVLFLHSWNVWKSNTWDKSPYSGSPPARLSFC